MSKHIPTMNLYGSGGLGLNNNSHFVKYNGKEDPGFCKLKTYSIDTSDSNIGIDNESEDAFLLEGKKGSGKRRLTNYPALVERSKEILLQFPPSEINVFVHSASGGSGSVIGPVLVSELLSRGHQVIVLMVGSTNSEIEVKNTRDTLMSYSGIVEKRGMPVNILYRENSLEHPRGKVDSDIQTAVVMLSTMFSGQNSELDHEDMVNFLNYNRVTALQPTICQLEFFHSKIQLEKHESLMAVASLLDRESSEEINVNTPYRASGFVPDPMQVKFSERFKAQLPVHACLIAGYFNPIIDRLQKKLDQYAEQRNATVSKSIIPSNVKVGDDGMVF